jgi:hypothetical protein
VGWSNQNVDELTAPSTVPFAPGQNVTGLGSQVPSELVAAGITNALVFYSSDWNPSATVPKTKYRYVCAVGGSLVFGMGYCTNPSVSQVATLVTTHSEGLTVQGGLPEADFEVFNVNGNSAFQFSAVASDTNPQFLMRDDAGVLRSRLLHSVSLAITELQLGAQTFVTPDAGGYTQVGLPIVKDTSWTTLPLSANWSSDAARPAQYRLMPDGTVMLRGHATKSINAVNGETVWTSLTSAYQPAGVQEYLAACGTRTYNGSQKLAVQTNGSAILSDPDTTKTGDVVLSSIRYPVI